MKQVQEQEKRLAVRDLRKLPKVDLHVHLECAIRSDTLRRLAQSNRVDLPESLLAEGYTFRDFEDFRAAVHGIRPCLCKASDFSLAGFELCHQHAAEGVRYFEVSFTLGAHGVRLGDWDMPISALLDGLQLGRERYGVESRVIVDHGRSQPEEVAMRALVAALKYRERGVIGFGLGGNEQRPPELFTRVFLAAIDGGLHSVPHAGEMSGAASIRGAIVHLKAERIGHGIRILEDPELVAFAREREIALEVCPTSNVMLGMVRSRQEHPLRELIEAGLTVTLNSDIPGVLRTDVTAQYTFAREQFALDDRALAKLAWAGVKASFADPKLKAELNRDINSWLAFSR
jgi:adenosine deaminase